MHFGLLNRLKPHKFATKWIVKQKIEWLLYKFSVLVISAGFIYYDKNVSVSVLPAIEKIHNGIALEHF